MLVNFCFDPVFFRKAFLETFVNYISTDHNIPTVCFLDNYSSLKNPLLKSPVPFLGIKC